MMAKLKHRLRLAIYTGVILIFITGQASADKFQEYVDKAQKQVAESKDKKAIDNYRKALKIKENSPQIYRAIAECFINLGLPDSAIAYYEGAIVHNPRDIDAYQRIGSIYNALKNYHEAMSWYERGMDIGMLSPSSYYALGTIYYRWMEYNRAKEYFQRSIQVDTSFSHGYYGLGLTGIALADTDAAITDLEKSEVDGLQPKAAYYLGIIAFRRGDLEKAERWLKRYIGQEPNGEYAGKVSDLLLEIGQNNEKSNSGNR